MYRQINEQASDGHTDRQMSRHQTNRQTVRQTNEQASDGQTDK